MPRKPKDEVGTSTALVPSPTLEQPSDSRLVSYLNDAQVQILLQSTPSNKVRTREGRGGTKLRYVDHAYVTELLNRAFGFNWDFELIEENLITGGTPPKPVEVSVKGKLTIRTASGVVITKQQYGAQAIDYSRSDPSMPVSLGDAKKGAASDALKKCASLLGVALDLYDSDGDIGRDREGAGAGGTGVDVRYILNYLNKCKALGFKTEDDRLDLKAIDAAGGIIYSIETEAALLERLKQSLESA